MSELLCGGFIENDGGKQAHFQCLFLFFGKNMSTVWLKIALLFFGIESEENTEKMVRLLLELNKHGINNTKNDLFYFVFFKTFAVQSKQHD